MLLEFSVENFLSFKEKTTFSMLPHKSYKELWDTNTTETGGTRVDRVLNSAVIFGPNASGKTNLFKAMDFFRVKLLSSNSNDVKEQHLKYGFGDININEPTKFEIIFFTNRIIYEYSYALFDGKIVEESLMSLENAPKKQWKLLFKRSAKYRDGVKFGNALRGDKQSIFEKTRPENLYLRSLYEWNNPSVKYAFEWVKFMMDAFISPEEIANICLYTTLEAFVNETPEREKIVNLLKNADFGIDNIEVHTSSVELQGSKEGSNEMNGFIISNNLPGILIDRKSSQIWDAKFDHVAIDESGEEIRLKINHKHEALGTRKLFALSGPILDFLEKGSTVMIDELSCSMHPLLTEAIIKLFNDPEINTRGAQLIFNTHDVYFLNKSIFRRDQIWFANKKTDGSTELTGLNDYNVRNDEALGAKYLLGAYGAVPFINHIDLVKNDGVSNGEEEA